MNDQPKRLLPAWGVMVTHADRTGMVTTRLWVVGRQTANWIAGQLGAPDMEQVQTPEQSLAGAKAGQGTVLRANQWEAP